MNISSHGTMIPHNIMMTIIALASNQYQWYQYHTITRIIVPVQKMSKISKK
ncbi:hypothetical protein DYY66_1063 [Candidatus Nitrosotalea sp. FS]|uniref:hypothetical protein n=1 Tax=Candidatus Nitrosotalea sp. FS TaxID=2341021 RepID=UPI00140BF556|nr:hypothetical protein [Candidatus Nitrosotalea sp. FS]NHH99004.1 hypothetical protein [Candidatus Nitrosotalea sp. FS]